MRRTIAPFLCTLMLGVLLSHCARSPYVQTNRSYKKQSRALARELRQRPASQPLGTAPRWVGTTNFGLRKPNLVVIHHTAQNSCDQTLYTFTQARTQVSAHYVICKDGTIHHMLNDYLRAWHGGVGRWGAVRDVNSSSIGIELDNNGLEPFASPQIHSLLTLLDSLKQRYNIPTENFIGHADIAPTRKVDPNVHFPWKLLSERGFGLWWTDTSCVAVPQGFNSLDALRIIGYEVRDTAAAIRAFKRKFLQQDSCAVLSVADRKVLYTLYQQSL